jgi:hypothetical protein
MLPAAKVWEKSVPANKKKVGGNPGAATLGHSGLYYLCAFGITAAAVQAFLGKEIEEAFTRNEWWSLSKSTWERQTMDAGRVRYTKWALRLRRRGRQLSAVLGHGANEPWRGWWTRSSSLFDGLWSCYFHLQRGPFQTPVLSRTKDQKIAQIVVYFHKLRSFRWWSLTIIAICSGNKSLLCGISWVKIAAISRELLSKKLFLLHWDKKSWTAVTSDERLVFLLIARQIHWSCVRVQQREWMCCLAITSAHTWQL